MFTLAHEKIKLQQRFWCNRISKPGLLTIPLMHNYICRSLKPPFSQAVALKKQMAERGWQVRCLGKAVSLPSSKVSATAGPQWTDSSPPEYKESLISRLTSCSLHPGSQGRQRWHCRTIRHRACFWRPPSVTWKAWVLILPFCNSKWAHCLLIYLYQLVW